jgi:simple sugar transport system ATP-binding protein
VHCLVGENGSGKSTLIKILSGVHAPDAGGEIKMGGVAYPNLTPHQARQLGIQVIFQDLSLFPNLTVEENIAIGLELSAPFRPPPRKEMRDAAKAALARLDAQLPLDAAVGRHQSHSADRRHLPRAGGECPSHSKITDAREVDLLLARFGGSRQGVSIVFVSHRLGKVVKSPSG